MKRSFWKSILSGSGPIMLVSGICNLMVLLTAPLAGAQTTNYVATTGSDSNPGTSAQPFRTITYALSMAGPGTNIIVEPGTYTDYEPGWGIHLRASGTASKPIILRSQVRGGAIIDGQNASDRPGAIYVTGGYNVVDGFKVRNGTQGGISVWSNTNQILNCEIDHNGNPYYTGNQGRTGIYENTNLVGNVFAGNYIHDNGRTNTTGFQYDHGLYLGGHNDLVLNNISIRNPGSGLQIDGETTVSNMKVYNNVFAWNGTEGIIVWLNMNGLDIKNNICFSNAIWGIHFEAATGSGVAIDKNLIYGNGSGNWDNPHNDGGNVDPMFGTTISSDPQLANETKPGFDAHLTPNSPAIGQGQNLSSYFTTDLEGNPRPSSGPWDIGAYEYESATSAYYVATNGSDSNPGTLAQPFRTITHAYSLAGPGTNVVVEPGTYTDYETGWGLHLGSSGTASKPIVLQSQVRGAAIIDGQNASDRPAGIYITGAYNIVDGFEIKHGGGKPGSDQTGLSIYGGIGEQILNCEIDHNGNINGGSGLYESENSSGNVFAGNYSHDNGAANGGLDHGLYLSGDNDVVINNVCSRNTGTGLQIAGYTTVSNMKVYNNVFAWNGYNGIIIWTNIAGVDIKNNILYANTNWGIHFVDANGTGVVIDKNLIYGNGLGDHDNPGQGVSVTWGTSISSDPHFANETQSGFDAHLTPGSPAIGAGDNFYSLFTTDLAGNPRPSSGAWDLGAYAIVGTNGPSEEFTNDVNTIALYHFNGNYNDSSANGFNLTPFGTVTLPNNPGWMQHPLGATARFSNLGDKLVVTIPDSAVEPGPSSQTPLSIEARIYVRGYKAYGVTNVFLIGLAQDYDAQLAWYDPIWPDSGQPIGPYVVGSSAAYVLTASQWQNAVSLNAWHKFKLTFAADGTTACYIDGNLVNSVATSILWWRPDPWVITLGNFDGDIDEVRISNVVR